MTDSLLCFNYINIDTGRAELSRCLCALTLLYVNAHYVLVVHRQLFALTMDVLYIKINKQEETYTNSFKEYALVSI